MKTLPNCPKCDSEYTYEDMNLLICPECAHEWQVEIIKEFIVKDSNGTLLQAGDSITIIKDLKIKGSSSVIKVGTKVKNIRLFPSDDDHTIDCKVPGIGSLKITPKYVKKI
ncbi:MAG: Alkylphosphonate utilization operon protein PhnA [uncultured Campylobacterales bacterium]|uniref:Alkylphosphonate utilization operon protein PhnA n=1 Tax=uncultured Campylobacterales bacterium TaxID=352960 RepID=A0A6S6RUI2_9BACT|nr:MAG: Alkylphosphonate utilization operon protein PhnA [uncultured Campylobacterales bacterium]